MYLGIDFGTSGCRACAIDRDGTVQGQAVVPLAEPARQGDGVEQAPRLWQDALYSVLRNISQQIDIKNIISIAVDGTSSTLFLTDADGNPLTLALMYNDGRATAEAQRIGRQAPRDSAAHGPTSGLAKLLWLRERYGGTRVRHVVHQADWIAGRLTGRFGISDTNNCLKLGYDPLLPGWPEWLRALLGEATAWLPEVVAPGTPIGTVSSPAAEMFGLPREALVVAGTTDSTAAIIATGVSAPGEAVTSLGSTLVVKVISTRPVFAPEYGVYSQPLGDLWLVGGGSNCGGTVLRQHFTAQQLQALSLKLKPDEPTGLDYYPLPAPGERFPVCDPDLAPRLSPRPADDAKFLQGMLEAMARIEKQGYDLLARLGAPYPVSVASAGGGAANAAWTRMRAVCLDVPVRTPPQQEAAYGAALLARQGAQAC